MNIIMAIDYGKKFTGLALYNKDSDPYPNPFDRLAYKNDLQMVKDILHMAKMEDVDTLVLGVPTLLDGQETNMTQEVKNFGELLKKQTQLELFFQDETLSTYEAKKRMENSPRYNFQVDLRHVDALAACIILEDFVGTH